MKINAGKGKMPPGSPPGITRRDFLHDLSLASLAAGLPGTLAAAHSGGGSDNEREVGAGSGYYPPTRTGMRGTHPGAFETAHRLAREGGAFENPERLEEHYDLVVVGAGISGLAAAYFYRERYGPDTRILLLDNHDDFGGHAKRNEFHQAGAMRLAWGGTVNIEYQNYSDTGHRLLRELGVDVERLLRDFQFNWGGSGSGLDVACWFDREHFGRDQLIAGLSFQDFDRKRLLRVLEQLPVSAAARAALRRFLETDAPLFPDMSRDERRAFARSTRYEDFMRDHGALPDEVMKLFSAATTPVWGVRAEDMSVAECIDSGLPGAHLLGMESDGDLESAYPRAAMFPDGNASIARLLVRALIPGAFPRMGVGDDPFDIVTADLDYARLDEAASPVRLRLSSTVVRARNRVRGDGDGDGDGVSVSYVQDDRLREVTAGQCVLACYNRIIPYLCPELPERQKAALGQCFKRPMVVVNVLLKDGRAIQRSGIAQAYLPGSMLQLVALVSGIHGIAYRSDWQPGEPCVLQFFAGMAADRPRGLSMVQQSQAGRQRLLQMTFADFENEVKRVLAGVWGPSGLDAEADIRAITVNRWPHGYARDLLDLEEPEWLSKPGPYEIGRQPFGNIAIANSDAGADAYTHTAIDQAWRAVGELPAVTLTSQEKRPA